MWRNVKLSNQMVDVILGLWLWDECDVSSIHEWRAYMSECNFSSFLKWVDSRRVTLSLNFLSIRKLRCQDLGPAAVVLKGWPSKGPFGANANLRLIANRQPDAKINHIESDGAASVVSMSHGPVWTPQFTPVQLTRASVFGADPKAESLFEDTRNRRSYYSGKRHSYFPEITARGSAQDAKPIWMIGKTEIWHTITHNVRLLNSGLAPSSPNIPRPLWRLAHVAFLHRVRVLWYNVRPNAN